MYGIRNRPAFINYHYFQEGSRADSAAYAPNKTKRYYSSLDAEIYFSDYYVDEIVHIQFSVEQNVLPLFGYNSYVYDEVALGNRLIQGQFTINFTSPGYLFALLEQIKKDINVLSNNQNISKAQEGTMDELEDGPGRTRQEKGALWNTTFDIDVMLGEENTIGGAVHTVLEGVVILGSSMQIDTTGNPVTETYSFIARDIHPID